MIRVQKRLAKGIQVLNYYTTNQWNFDITNSTFMWNQMNEAEKITYQCDARDFSEEEAQKYFEDGILGARRYLLNQPDEKLPSAKRLLKM